MHSHNTIVGLRRGAQTIVASTGVRTSSADLILRHRSNLLHKTAVSGVLLACTAPEAQTSILLQVLNQELESKADLRSAGLSLSRHILGQPALRERYFEAILASRNFLAVLNHSGDLVEPDEGFVALGVCAQVASGVLKALLLHSNLSGEEIVRESLVIAGQIKRPGHEEVSLEVL